MTWLSAQTCQFVVLVLWQLVMQASPEEDSNTRVLKFKFLKTGSWSSVCSRPAWPCTCSVSGCLSGGEYCDINSLNLLSNAWVAIIGVHQLAIICERYFWRRHRCVYICVDGGYNMWRVANSEVPFAIIEVDEPRRWLWKYYLSRKNWMGVSLICDLQFSQLHWLVSTLDSVRSLNKKQSQAAALV